MRSLLMRMSPEVAASRPASIRNVVVLPQPDRPRSNELSVVDLREINNDNHCEVFGYVLERNTHRIGLLTNPQITLISNRNLKCPAFLICVICGYNPLSRHCTQRKPPHRISVPSANTNWHNRHCTCRAHDSHLIAIGHVLLAHRQSHRGNVWSTPEPARTHSTKRSNRTQRLLLNRVPPTAALHATTLHLESPSTKAASSRSLGSSAKSRASSNNKWQIEGGVDDSQRQARV